jgi:long-subunit acyl-CoA synthetase (AMP-forming)
MVAVARWLHVIRDGVFSITITAAKGRERPGFSLHRPFAWEQEPMSYRRTAVAGEASEAAAENQITPTLVQQIVRQAAVRTGVTALHDRQTGRRITYPQLARATRRAAKALALRGLQKGDVACLYSPNLPEYAVAVLTVTLAGGVVTLAAPTLSATELAQQLSVTTAQWLVTTRAGLRNALLAASQTAVRHVYSFDPAVGAHHVGELFETTLAEDERTTEALLVPQRDVMAWLFDSEPAGRQYRYAEASDILAARASLSEPLELGNKSLAQAENLWAGLQALQAGKTIFLY